MKSTTKRVPIFIVISFFFGIVWLSGLKLILLKPDKVHYHANFALYIDGQRDEFESGVFYEEIDACNASSGDPKTRVHLHDRKNHVIHVHSEGATWGHFFSNLGYTLGDTVLVTRSDTFVDDVEGNQLTFILNGKPAALVANKLIESTDRLLINYGSEGSDVLNERFNTVSNDAAVANTLPDPASCSGSDDTFWNRLKRSIW